MNCLFIFFNSFSTSSFLHCFVKYKSLGIEYPLIIGFLSLINCFIQNNQHPGVGHNSYLSLKNPEYKYSGYLYHPSKKTITSLV